MDNTGGSGMHMNSATLFEAMIEAAKAAGAGLMQDRSRHHTLHIRRKSGADFFSEADLNAESTVRKVLSEAAPDFGFLGEEGGLIDGKDPDSTWIVDPLDGTTNFLRGTAHVRREHRARAAGRHTAAVTYVPAMGELFHARKRRMVHSSMSTHPHRGGLRSRGFGAGRRHSFRWKAKS